MLLAIDLGNTSLKAACFAGQETTPAWKKTFSLQPRQGQVLDCMRALQWPGGIRQAVIASVVPAFSRPLAEMLETLLGVEPRVLTYRDVPLKILVDNPAEVGIDRLLNALAAGRLYGKPAVVVDCGTALTFDLVNPAGDYEGGLIAPSPEIAGRALSEQAALLPRLELDDGPAALVGKNTKQAMRAGIIIGFAELVSGILDRLEREWQGGYVTVGAGGGLPALIPQIDRKIKYDPELTLKGIRLAAES